jgi:hypothetical protein
MVDKSVDESLQVMEYYAKQAESSMVDLEGISVRKRPMTDYIAYLLDEYITKQKDSEFQNHSFKVVPKAISLIRMMVENMIIKMAESAYLVILMQSQSRKTVRNTLFERDFQTVVKVWSWAFGSPDMYRSKENVDKEEKIRKRRHRLSDFKESILKAKQLMTPEQLAEWNNKFSSDTIGEKRLAKLGFKTETDWFEAKIKYRDNILERKGGVVKDGNDKEKTSDRATGITATQGLSAPTIKEIIMKGTSGAVLKISGNKIWGRRTVNNRKKSKEAEEKEEEQYGVYNIIRLYVRAMLIRVLTFACENKQKETTKSKWRENGEGKNELQISFRQMLSAFQKFGIDNFT